MKQLKWFEKPFLLAAVQCNYGEDSFDIMKNHVITNGFSGEQLLHINAIGHVSSYEEKRDGQKLSDYLKKAKENDLKEILYWNVHCVYEESILKNPEWKQLDKDLSPIMAYGNQYLICINSPWIDTYYENLKKLCTHDLDGLFLDGPVFLHNGCYCEACQKAFKEKYNKSLFDAEYKEFLEFRTDSVTKMIKTTYEIKEELNPNIKLYINNSALRADVTGSNTTKVYPYVDFLGTEGGFCHINKDFDYLRTTSHAKYIESKANGKPYVIFIAGDAKPWSYIMHTKDETRRLYQLSLAQGANIWYGIHGPTKMMHSSAGHEVKKLNEFINNNQVALTQTKSKSNIGLLWSDATANYYASSVVKSDFTEEMEIGKDKEGNHHEALLGIVDMLQRGHNQYDIIDQDKIFNNKLFNYELLILPTYACMTNKEADILETYVKNGGNLIATFDTGLYDEYGVKREQGLLDDMFGIVREKLIKYSDTGVAYGQFTDNREESIFPHHGSSWNIKIKDDCQVLGEVSKEMPGRYVAYPEVYTPCMVKRKHGSGQVLYISSTMAENYYTMCNSNLRVWFQEQVDTLSNRTIITNAPQSVEISLRHQPSTNNLLVHIVNMTRGPGRPMEETIDVTNINIIITGIKAKTIKGIYTGRDYLFTNTPKGVQLIIDALHDYEVLVVT
ncbi:MAG: beta-galactosidase trimerization domain-containing protein [Clostridiales bacterium]|nr:beta-galactosidase trimerization domain-containing protein [Clostridiales bacterium]